MLPVERVSKEKPEKSMKMLNYSIWVTCLLIGSTGMIGCSKQNETPPTATQNEKALGNAASEAQKTVTGATEQAKETGQKSATEAASAAQSQVQGIIDQAKALMAQNKYSDALALLQQKLTGLQLTPEQQKLVDALKEQIQKAIASAATKEATGKATEGMKKALGQ
jgi:hypothetical protein